MDIKNHLGWGIIGTSRGYQYSSDGLDRQFNFAKSFDLNQQYGNCLPEPKYYDFNAPLYLLNCRDYEKNKVLNLIGYHSIYEQGQTRSGTFFGSFLQFPIASFDEYTTKNVFSVLWELAKFQYINFIDANSRSYIQSISNVEIQAPEKLLVEINSNLKPQIGLLMPVKQNGDLFIACREKEIPKVLQILLDTGLFLRFNQIFFSENLQIIQNMQELKIQCISSETLFSADFWQKDLKQVIYRLQAELTQTEDAKMKVWSELQQEKQLQTELVNQQVEQIAGNYRQQIHQLQADLEQKQAELNTKSELADLGQEVFQVTANYAQSFGEGHLAQFAQPKTDMAVLNAISELKYQLSKQSVQSQSISNEQAKSPILSIILGGLASLFFILAVWGWAMALMPEVSKEELDKVSATLKNEQVKTQQLETDLQKMEKEKNELEEKLNEQQSKSEKSKEAKNAKNP